MALTPSEFEKINTIQNFTPTMESGFVYTAGNAWYKVINSSFIFFSMIVTKSSAGTVNGTICTLPTWMRPIKYIAVSAEVRNGTYVDQTPPSAAISDEGKVRVYSPSTSTYYIYVSGVIPISGTIPSA